MATGTVKWFDNDKGFGFIAPGTTRARTSFVAPQLRSSRAASARSTRARRSSTRRRKAPQGPKSPSTSSDLVRLAASSWPRSCVGPDRVQMDTPIGSIRMSDVAIEVEGLVKTFGDVRALDGVDLETPRRHRARPAGPQRGREDHRRARHDDAAGPRRRHGPGRRAGHRQGRNRAAGEDRAGRPVRRGRREPHRAGEPDDGRPPVRGGPQVAKARGTRADRALRPRRCRQPARQDLLGRHAPAAGPRRRAGGQAAGDLPRRADDGAGPALAAGPVGHDRGAGSPRAAPCCSPPSTSTRPTAWP